MVSEFVNLTESSVSPYHRLKKRASLPISVALVDISFSVVIVDGHVPKMK